MLNIEFVSVSLCISLTLALCRRLTVPFFSAFELFILNFLLMTLFSTFYDLFPDFGFLNTGG